MTAPHTPVMLKEVLDVLNPRDGAVYVDGTFGAGGYTTAILETADCRVFGIDRDPRALAVGDLVHARIGDPKAFGRLALRHAKGYKEVL